MRSQGRDENLVEDIDCYEDVDDNMILPKNRSFDTHNNDFMEELLSQADNFEEYFYCVLSFLQDGIKVDPVKLPWLTFPQKLYILLNYDDTARGIVEWCLEGDAFQILNRDRFLQEIVPRYFKQNCFRSFDRQTHLYRFLRYRVRTSRAVSSSTSSRYISSSYCYRHPLFLRNRVELISTICRPKPEGQPHRKLANFLPPPLNMANDIFDKLSDVDKDLNSPLSVSEVAETGELKRKATNFLAMK